MEYKCAVCGKKAKEADKKTLQAFCTKECFIQYEEVTCCVLHFNIGEKVDNDTEFRQIIHTNENQQTVAMRVKPGERIGDDKDSTKPEVHPRATQHMRVLEGTARVTIYSGEKTYPITLQGYGGEDTVIIPPNVYHLVENVGPRDLQLVVIYSPPVH